MNLSLPDRSVPPRAVARRRLTRFRTVAAGGIAVLLGSLAATGQALAQGASPGGGIGAQLNLMSGEVLDSGGTAAGAAMYIAAVVVFLGAAWAIWKSRQPQNREGGYMGMGLAGLALCGLFAAGGTWINKAAVSTSGAAATVSNAPKAVTFN